MNRTGLLFPLVFGDRPWWFFSPSKLICLKLGLPLPSMRHKLFQMCKKYWYSRLLKTKQTNEKKEKENPSQCPLERPHFSASEHSELTWDEWWAERLFCYFFPALSLIYTHTCTHVHKVISIHDFFQLKTLIWRMSAGLPHFSVVSFSGSNKPAVFTERLRHSLCGRIWTTVLSWLTRLHFPVCLSKLFILLQSRI